MDEEFLRYKSIKCSKHSFQPLDQIDLTGNSPNGRICQVCIQKNKIPSDQYLSMYELFAQKEGELLSSYPSLNNPYLQEQIQKYCEEKAPNSNIDSFFRRLREDIEAAIQEIEKRVKQELIKIENSKQILLKELNEIAETNKLKELLIAEHQDLNKFLKEKWNNAFQNSQTMQKCIQQYKENTSILDLQFKQKQVNSLISSLKNFSLFDEPQINIDIEKNHNNNLKNGINNTLNYKNNVNLIKSILGTSLNLTSINAGTNSLQLINKFSESQDGEAYLDFDLNPSKLYAIRVNYQTKQRQPYFFFGITPSQTNDPNWSFYNKMSYYSYSGGYGISKYIKGPNINNRQNSNESFEVSIFLNKKMLRVSSLPDSETIIELDDPNKIKPETSYRFFVHIFQAGDLIEITDIIESDQCDNNTFL